MDEIEELASHPEVPTCGAVDDAVVEGAAVVNIGSTPESRVERLNPTQQAAGIGRAKAFSRAARKMVSSLDADQLAGDEADVFVAALARLEARLDVEPEGGDVRVTFQQFLADEAEALRPVITALVDVCPDGPLAALLQPGVG